jgi:hypothetical protein
VKPPSATDLLHWYDRHRRILPWRAPPGERAEPYHVWLSEIMLQQTTVATVGPRFARFLARFPDLPTMAEQGHADFEMLSWTGLFVPGGTPRAVVDRLNAEITKVVREPEYANWLAETGSEVVTPTPDQFRDFVRADFNRWRKRSDDFGIKYEQ